jgi:hypothetical protein
MSVRWGLIEKQETALASARTGRVVKIGPELGS